MKSQRRGTGVSERGVYGISILDVWVWDEGQNDLHKANSHLRNPWQRKDQGVNRGGGRGGLGHVATGGASRKGENLADSLKERARGKNPFSGRGITWMVEKKEPNTECLAKADGGGRGEWTRGETRERAKRTVDARRLRRGGRTAL